jgi:hypothetical protein
MERILEGQMPNMFSALRHAPEPTKAPSAGGGKTIVFDFSEGKYMSNVGTISVSRLRELIADGMNSVRDKFSAALQEERQRTAAIEREFAEFRDSREGLLQPKGAYEPGELDQASVLFDEKVKKRSAELNIPYTEAYKLVSRECPRATPVSPQFEEIVDPQSVLFYEAVSEYSRRHGVSYVEAFNELK